MTTFDDLLNQYDRGALSRRQLMQGLLLLGAPVAAHAQPEIPADPVRARTINHVHIVVNDLDQALTNRLQRSSRALGSAGAFLPSREVRELIDFFGDRTEERSYLRDRIIRSHGRSPVRGGFARDCTAVRGTFAVR